MRYKNINHFDQFRFQKDLHSARWGRGMTMQTVATAMKKSKATISRWESGHTIPTVSDFILICWFFDLNPLSYFIADSQIEKTCKMFDAAKKENKK